MKRKVTISRTLKITGVVALLAGIIDPLEGSILIAIGSILLTIAAKLTEHHYSDLWAVCTTGIIIGIVAMFYLSELGGIGGKSGLPLWWGVLILPYPIGWLTIIISLISLVFHSKRRNKAVH